MKRHLGMLAVLIALFAANASSNTARETAALPLPAVKASPAPRLFAQDRPMPTCSLDNRQVPVGSTSCQEGRLMICERSGWTSTGKSC